MTLEEKEIEATQSLSNILDEYTHTWVNDPFGNRICKLDHLITVETQDPR